MTRVRFPANAIRCVYMPTVLFAISMLPSCGQKNTNGHAHGQFGGCYALSQTTAADGALYVHNVKAAKLVHLPCRWLCCVETFTIPSTCIGGIVDSIAASQAVDPGSIPGQCSKVSCRRLVVACSTSLLNQQCMGALNYQTESNVKRMPVTDR